VSVIVLTASGPRHLPDCLDSLAALDYPRDAVEVIVVDNGSAEDPRPAVARHYPSARVIRNDRNLGFCGGNNVGVSAASHEWLFFLNDDTRVDARLLREAFDTAARRQALSVAAFVLDWTGERVDFAGGGVNFDGHGFQHGVGSTRLEDFARERPVAFANGAAMLIRRDAYLASGGFPDPYFAYYEDVALGWALWLQGHQVWLCPRAIVYHRHHGTSAQSANAARRRNLERNASFTILTHGSNQALPDLLAAGLLLAAERVLLGAGLGGLVGDPLPLDTGRSPRADRPDLRLYVAHLRAELVRRGARREHGVLGSLVRVGLRGLAGTSISLYRLGRPDRPAAPPIATRVDTPAEWVANLAAVGEWCRRAGEMEPLRRALQESRQQTEHDFASGVAENWLNALPVEPARQAEYERVHSAVVAAFDLERFVRAVQD
jgi:GT2 family glycosyltransferase